MVGQVTVVAILMIVQGALEIIAGLVLALFAMIMPALLAEAVRQQQAQGGPNPLPGFPGDFGDFAAWIYGSMAVLGFVPGILRLIAGIRNLRYRGRTMGIVAHLLGLLSMCTVYCSLTSIGLAIYGLIVYFNSDVIYAFQLGEEGVAAAEIKARYYSDPMRFQLGVPRDELPEDEAGRREERPPERAPRREQGDQFYGEDFRS
jgi:hypothetical protein